MTINTSLLYAKWNKNNICENQNNLVLTEDDTYTDLHSGNSRESNTTDSYQTSGIYTVRGNKIIFKK